MPRRFKTSSEAKAPSSESLAVVDAVTGCITPDDAKLDQWTQDYITAFRDRFAFDLDYAKHYFDTGAGILDVASAPLVLVGALRKAGYDAQGVDIEPDRFASAIQRLELNVSQCNIEAEPLPFTDNHFDGIVFNEIFEHLRLNLIFTIGELNRVLKQGAVLLLSTPNPHSLHGHMRYLFNRETMFYAAGIFDEYAKLKNIGHMGHVREYGTTDIIDFFHHMGFEIESLIYRGPRATRFLPDTSRPFITYVFRKVNAPSNPEDLKGKGIPAIQPWKRKLATGMAIPFVWGSFFIQKLLKR